ncbi:MAG: hypothetical protein P8Z30_07255 [Acidobacteriota bacterium]
MEPIIILVGILLGIAILLALILAPLKLYSIDGNLVNIRNELAALNAETRAARLEAVQQTELLQAMSRNLVASREQGQP